MNGQVVSIASISPSILLVFLYPYINHYSFPVLTSANITVMIPSACNTVYRDVVDNLQVSKNTYILVNISPYEQTAAFKHRKLSILNSDFELYIHASSLSLNFKLYGSGMLYWKLPIFVPYSHLII